jgi:hypothetical protein
VSAAASIISSCHRWYWPRSRPHSSRASPGPSYSTRSARIFIRTAQAKGATERVVLYRHALRVALVPIVTMIGVEFAYLLGGAVLTETVFAWPGSDAMSPPQCWRGITRRFRARCSCSWPW